jgi:hypothetical protein
MATKPLALTEHVTDELSDALDSLISRGYGNDITVSDSASRDAETGVFLIGCKGARVRREFVADQNID